MRATILLSSFLVLPSDKEKAYEEALLEEKEADKKASLNALSDYWQEDEGEE